MSALAGTTPLILLAARRDRVLIPATAIALTAFSVGSARATVALYTDPQAAVRDLGAVLSAPSTLALYGPASTTSLAGLSIFKTLLVGSVLVGLLAFAIVRRHTRVEEEEGRFELIGAGAVGRQAPLAAGVALAVLATLLVSLLSAVGLMAIGFPVAGSLGFAAAWAIPGLVMTGVTAIACQLTSSARGTTGWALGTLGVLFALRAVGDTASTSAGQSLRWLSPLGWVSQVFPFGRDRTWLVTAGAVVGAALVGVAFALLERRDLGTGLLPSRPGPATARRSLGSAGGLVWRLSRPAVIGWVVAIAMVGALYGSLIPQVADMLSDQSVIDVFAKLAGVPPAEVSVAVTAFYSATMLKVSSAAMGAAGVGMVLRLAAEERTGRSEVVLASAVARGRWFLQHLLGGAALVVALTFVMATVMGWRGHAGSTSAPTLTQTLSTALETVPANLVIVAVAGVLVALGARWAPYAWGALALSYIVGEFGATMNLPTWVSGLSPYAHVTTYPMASWDWAEAGSLVAVAVALAGFGLAAYRRRDTD